jgi:hypothetical protein
VPKKIQFISYREIAGYTCIPLSSIRYLIKTGRFPKPYPSSVGRMRWKKDVLDRFLEKRENSGIQSGVWGSPTNEGNEMSRLKKLFKGIDPSIKIYRYRNLGIEYLAVPPRGLVLENEDGISFHYAPFLDIQVKQIQHLKLIQCPDGPFCKSCKEMLRSGMLYDEQYEEVER